MSSASPLHLYSDLVRCWLNEKHAPELLPFASDTVSSLRPFLVQSQDVCDRMQRLAASIAANDGAIHASGLVGLGLMGRGVVGSEGEKLCQELKLQYPIVQLGIDRVKFVMTSYLRCRLKKIDQFVMFYLSSVAFNSRLSQPEMEYAIKLADLLENGFHQPFIGHIPENFQSLTDPEMIDKPDINTFVLIQVVENVQDYAIGYARTFSLKYHVEMTTTPCN